MKRTEILVVPAWYDHRNLTKGDFIHRFCEALQANGFNVTLLYTRVFGLSEFARYMQPLRFDVQPGYTVIYNRKLNFYPAKLFSNAAMRLKRSVVNTTLKRLARVKVDCIHIQSVCNNLSPYLAYEISSNLKAPYILTEHYTSFKEAGEYNFIPYLTTNYVKNIVKQAIERVAVSKYAAHLFEEYFDAKFITIPNIIAGPYFSLPFKQKQFGKNETFRFIFIGGFTERKGVFQLLKAVNTIKNKGANIALMMIGGGELKNKLESYIIESDLIKEVTLLQQKTTNEIISYLDEAHCVVSASHLETFGLVIAEGFLRGRPVVAMNSGAVTELITATNGIVCEGADTVALTGAMLKMMETYANFDQRQIREQAMEQFSEKSIIASYTKVYKSAIDKTNSNNQN